MQRTRVGVAFAALLAPAILASLVSSCGARSGLYVGDPKEDAGVDAPPDTPDVPDAPPDVPPDVPEDTPEVLPPCDPDLLYIYLVTSETELYRYRPDTTTFDIVGSLFCQSNGSPFSMGVARTGIAYVVYNDGQLFQVNVADASCEPTAWTAGQGGFDLFGMGFAIDDDLMGETLHVAQISFDKPSFGLGAIDTEKFVVDYIGPFSENLGNSIELTSSDDGKLYGYFLNSDGPGGFVVQIDKETAEILEATELPIGAQSSALAFAYWGGDFYIFTSDGAETTVTRYSPSMGTIEVVATLDRTVVGAGVTTCKIP